MRRPRRVEVPELPSGDTVEVEEARELIWQAMTEYLDAPEPDHVLVIAAPPGVGKTTLAVRLAELAAQQGKRAIYAGPRHDLFAELMALAGKPDSWYEWLPRQDGIFHGEVRTCEHADAMAAILRRGYRGMRGCLRYCGQGYIRNTCVWHSQKTVEHPIIYAQHQHVWGGHPIDFDLAIGDESPLSAFMHRWQVPPRFIYPKHLDDSDPIAPVIGKLKELAEAGEVLCGPALQEALGGAAYVEAQLQYIPLQDEKVRGSPKEASEQDFLHLLPLCRLLYAEATACLAGNEEYPARVVLTGKRLLLLLLRKLNDIIPRHLVWLDGTANTRIYEQLTGRAVRKVAPLIKLKGKVHQIIDRNYGKSHTEKYIPQLHSTVAHIASRYKQAAVISHKQYVDRIAGNLQSGHYYAERGTNEYLNCDALIVVGAPQPSLNDLQAMGAMVFNGRMAPFNASWGSKDIPFTYRDAAGQGLAHPTGGYWGDVDLSALLWQVREAEVIHAAHRVRPLLRDVDIWLVNNLPIAELPLTTIRTTRRLLGVPEGVSTTRWTQLLELSDAYVEGGFIDAFILLMELGMMSEEAQRCLTLLAQEQPTRWASDSPSSVVRTGEVIPN